MHTRKRIAVIGSGMAGLSVSCLLARDGHEVALFEKNWMPGGCSSSYWRKGYRFETGATTLVGLDEGMPLRHLLNQLKLDLSAEKLSIPMQVHYGTQTITRHQELEQWIAEAEKQFGSEGQRAFWERCFTISKQVWHISTRQLAFPPQQLNDLWQLASRFEWQQLKSLPAAWQTVGDYLRSTGLIHNQDFVKFVDEQLLITAQNTHNEVNMLFGATALCYTNFGNYYMPGGLIRIVELLVKYLENKGGRIYYREGVEQLQRHPGGWVLKTAARSEQFDTVISSIPLNNLHDLLPAGAAKSKISKKLLPSNQLSSALQLGIGFKPHRHYDCLHHQIHLPNPLPGIGSKSIFLSLHPANDLQRAPQGHMAASVSTHWHDPAANILENRNDAESAILEQLDQHDFIKRESIDYLHSSGPRSWEKWTGRSWGFVGGYPQYQRIKPWQMMGARVLKNNLYVCGDTTYPGQGIPGAVLSGLIAHHKFTIDL
jgi:C-3',4' desaturase CrtD